MVADGSLSFNASSFDNKPWYEIDTIDDLRQAEKLFPQEKLQRQKTADSLYPDYLNEKLLNGIISTPQIAGGVSVAR
jgi:NDP-sugar pyrophosphorylase family protein